MKAVVALAAVAAVTQALHYEKPPCASDETTGSIQGTNGTLCAPKCDAQGQCPTDVPPGTWNNATPACVLSDSKTGEHYCALSCKLFGCPPGAHCAMIGIVVGVCVYPNGTRTDALPNFVMKPEVHPLRAAQIAELKAMPGMTWTPTAHPRFAKQMPGASKDLCGVKGDQKEVIQAAIARGEIVEYNADENFVAPDSFDSAENWPQCAKVILDIRDQSNCGCCWAFGGTEAATDRMCIATNASLLLPLSAQDVCFNSNFDGCDGGQITTPWNYIKSTGAVTGSQQQPDDGKTDPFKGMGFCSSFSLPHCHHHGPSHGDPYPSEGAQGCPKESSPQGPTSCDSDAKAPHNDFNNDKYTFSGQIISPNGESSIQQAIVEGGPVEVAFAVYQDFENYGGGIYQHKSGGQVGGHAVKMVGWGSENGVKYWKIANSWNPYWGEKGYFRIIRGQNEGGIESQVTASAANAQWSKKSGPSPGPSPPGPGPSPGPGPPPAIDCGKELSAATCEARQSEGCHWCSFGGAVLCMNAAMPCPGDIVV